MLCPHQLTLLQQETSYPMLQVNDITAVCVGCRIVGLIPHESKDIDNGIQNVEKLNIQDIHYWDFNGARTQSFLSLKLLC